MPLNKKMALIIGVMMVSSTVMADAGSFYDDKYLYSDQDLIVLEQVYKAGKADGETVELINMVEEEQDYKDLSVGSEKQGFYANTAGKTTGSKSGLNKDDPAIASNSAKSISKEEIASKVSDQVKTIAKNSSKKIRKELIIPGEVDPMLLELDRFLNESLVIEQSKPGNMLEIVATTIPQGWRVYFSNTTTEDYVDEYEFFVPKVPRAQAFAKLEEAFGVEFRVMNQPEAPYVIVNKLKGGL